MVGSCEFLGVGKTNEMVIIKRPDYCDGKRNYSAFLKEVKNA